MDYYDLRQVALVGATAYVAYALYQRRTRSSVKDIPGPPNPSWIHGKVVTLSLCPSYLAQSRRTLLVLGDSRCKCPRKAHPREIWKCGSLEWTVWGILPVISDPRNADRIFVQEDRLWVADPKAINHILRNSCTVYRKPTKEREFIAMVLDRGLSWADGNVV